MYAEQMSVPVAVPLRRGRVPVMQRLKTHVAVCKKRPAKAQKITRVSHLGVVGEGREGGGNGMDKRAAVVSSSIV